MRQLLRSEPLTHFWLVSRSSNTIHSSASWRLVFCCVAHCPSLYFYSQLNVACVYIVVVWAMIQCSEVMCLPTFGIYCLHLEGRTSLQIYVSVLLIRAQLSAYLYCNLSNCGVCNLVCSLQTFPAKGGAIPPFPHTFSWRCGYVIKHRDKFAFTAVTVGPAPLQQKSSFVSAET
jgi:hypothetical protein